MTPTGPLNAIADSDRTCTFDVSARNMPLKPGFRSRPPNLESPFKQIRNNPRRPTTRPRREPQPATVENGEIDEIARKARNRAFLIGLIPFFVAVRFIV